MQVTPGEYLETALQPVKGAGRPVEAKNAVSSSAAKQIPSIPAVPRRHPLCWVSSVLRMHAPLSSSPSLRYRVADRPLSMCCV